MSVNFRISDGEDYYKDYDRFVEEYNKGTFQKIIMKDLGLGATRYRRYLEKATEEGLVEPRKKKIREEAKYYTKTPSGSFIVTHRDKVLDKQLTYGTYHTEEEAKARVKELMSKNWRE